MLFTTAKIYNVAKLDSMSSIAPHPVESPVNQEVASLFISGGWQVAREPEGPFQPDMIISQGGISYAVEIKAISEGRPDRVIALLSQAILQAQAHARQRKGLRPLAVVRVGAAARPLLDKVDRFSQRYAPDVAIGVVACDGARHFIGPGLEGLNAKPAANKRALAVPRMASDLFSDLNQWMLKVLLAPEVPEHLLAAARAEYRNASELAKAAKVSVMSASRFVLRLREEGFLDQSSDCLRLVRRAQLFRRWRSASLRSSPEMRMCFLNRGAGQAQLREAVSRHQGCLGLFAAANALQLGHVSGVPPYVYVRKLPRSEQDAWRGLVPAREGESVDIILKQAHVPQSIFRGAILAEGVLVADVLQVWLDVSGHPSRGKEQADFLGRKVLQDIIGDEE